MDKITLFKKAVEKLNDNIKDEYAADPDNWCVVHATKYSPKQHKDGTLYIPSTAMATDFKIPRTTVHTTFNHVVKGHMMGSWDDMPIVILTGYNDLVKQNGNPAEISAMDTYWSVNPERGLVLPKGTYVIQPSNDTLFSFNEHGATYKRDNYTEKEIKTIVQMLDKRDRELFEKYSTGDIEDCEIRDMYNNLWDDRVRKMYDSAKDKRAFLRGMFEESRFEILSCFLRNIVVRMTMEKMGFYEIHFSDGGKTSEQVADAANKMGIEATASNKGHSNSIYSDMEMFWGNIDTIFKGGFFDKYGIMNAPNLQSLSDFITSKHNNVVIQKIAQSFIENKKLDLVDVYEKQFMSLIDQRIFWANNYIEHLNREIAEVQSYNISDSEKEERCTEILQRQQEDAKRLQQLTAIKKISDFDTNLAEVIYKNAQILSDEFEAKRKELSSQPGYEDFIKKLQNQHNLITAKSFGGQTRF